MFRVSVRSWLEGEGLLMGGEGVASKVSGPGYGTALRRARVKPGLTVFKGVRSSLPSWSGWLYPGSSIQPPKEASNRSELSVVKYLPHKQASVFSLQAPGTVSCC